MKYIFFLLFVLMMAVGCSPAVTESTLGGDLPTQSPQPQATITPTTLWFLPTPTLTPVVLSTLPPTPDQRPGIGELLLEDDFTNSSNWSGLASTAGGNVALEADSLIIAITLPKTQLSSLRRDIELEDFYMDITADTNICIDQDEYGLIFRMSSNADLYRYTLSCDGQVRLARVIQGQTSFPQPWMSSGAVPRGAPGQSKLGVWAVGKEIRFFINDELQFIIQATNSTRGQIGVFARSAGENPLSVSFSNLTIYNVAP